MKLSGSASTVAGGLREPMTGKTNETPQARAGAAAERALEPLITECPSCLTRFRVSLPQLQRAGGKVRCGACLAIFNGIEHLTLDSADLYPDEDQARQALDDVLDELAGDSPAGTPSPSDPPPPSRSPPRTPIFAGYEDDEADRPEDTPPDPVRLDPVEPVDLHEARSDRNRSASAEVEATLPDPAGSPQAFADSAGPERLEPDVAHAFRVLSEEPPAEGPQKGRSDVEQAKPLRPAAVSSGVAAAAVPAPDSPAPDSAAPVGAEPVPFGEPATRRPLVWAGIAAGVLVFIAQVLWYQFDDWSHDPEWRAIYTPLCAVVGCTLPQQRDISLMSTRNLAVRSHPEQPGTLRVNAIIVNDADFPQPFPVLELRFTTVRGMLVAGRRFEPDEYLAGDAVGMSLIPPKTPVQIELTIDDPGPEAVNYFLRFL